MPILTAKHCRTDPEPNDGCRLLVMRYWPRGVRRERFDRWLRDLAPSVALLKAFRLLAADPELDPAAKQVQWDGFIRDYIAEMHGQRDLIAELRRRHEDGKTLTLLCGCHDPAQCHRSVLARLILEGSREPAG